jgi:hypothetical protein
MTMIAKRMFVSPTLGNVTEGQHLDVSPQSALGQHLKHHGLAEEVKSVRQEPGRDYEHKAGGFPTDAGEGGTSSSSPADQAPTKRKRGRPRKYPKQD